MCKQALNGGYITPFPNEKEESMKVEYDTALLNIQCPKRTSAFHSLASLPFCSTTQNRKPFVRANPYAKTF